MESVQEVVFIGLSGLTHHYGGLSPDNIASDRNRGSESNPRQAALQVVALARYLFSCGIVVGILPPQLRPYLPALTDAGFDMASAPLPLLEQASSSSFMWAANAATATSDGELHITTANLHTNPHRRIEAQATYSIIKQIFAKVPACITHPPLDAGLGLLDEGAANHMRLAPSHASAGLNVFVYGRRQNLAASQKIAKNHQIPAAQTLFLEQNADVINKGVFHNDVIAVSNENLLLVHAQAYNNGLADIARIEETYKNLHPQNKLQLIVISDFELTVEEAVESYFFNSQIVTKPDGKMVVVAPQELKTLHGGKAAILMENIRERSDNMIDEISYLDLKQSMKNGGGPACLRLRVVMTGAQLNALKANTGVLGNEKMFAALEDMIEQYYPQTLTPEGLRNPELLSEGKKFLTELGKFMQLIL